MKTKMKILGWLMIFVLALGATGAQAENTDTTQSVCVGTQLYHVEHIAGAQYTWSLTGGGTITPLTTDNDSINIDWTTVGGPYILSVFVTLNGCAGDPKSLYVTVVSAPVGPQLLAKTPNTNDVCPGTDVSATFIAGSGGVGCADEFEYSYDGSGTWTTYAEGTPIVTMGHTLVEIRGRRACDPTLGCGETPWVVLASWTVSAALPLSVEITADPNPVCEGQSILFTSSVTNGGSTVTYEWYVNGIKIDEETGPTYLYTNPVNGAIVTCKVYSTEPCVVGSPATSNEITVVVKPKPVTSPIWHN